MRTVSGGRRLSAGAFQLSMDAMRTAAHKCTSNSEQHLTLVDGPLFFQGGTQGAAVRGSGMRTKICRRRCNTGVSESQSKEAAVNCKL